MVYLMKEIICLRGFLTLVSYIAAQYAMCTIDWPDCII